MSSDTPKIQLALEPGDYIVSVHPAFGARAWRHRGEGKFEGHGGKIRRVAISDAINELRRAAEKHYDTTKAPID